MTFLVAARAKDGLVALSDRKETIPEPNGNEVSKYYLDVVKGFYLALSGDGVAAAYILNELRKSGVSSTVALKEMERLAANTQLAQPGHDPVAGHLVVAERGGIEHYTVNIENGMATVDPNSAAMPTEGDYRAVALCKNLTWGVDLTGMSCEEVAKYLHTLVNRIAETVGSVGDRDTYGIDMAIFTVGGVGMLERRTDKMGTISVVYKTGETGPLFGRNGRGI